MRLVFPFFHIPTQGVVQLICIFSFLVKGNKDLICLLFWKHPENQMIEGSLEVKLPTIWTDEKQSREEAERIERLEERRVEEKE